jgi:hypothetical protein
MRLRRPAFIAATLACGALLSGCSSSDDGADTTASPTAKPTLSTVQVNKKSRRS